MAESDILLSIDGDTTPLKGSLKNTLKWANKEASTFMKFGQMRDILGKFSGKGISIARGPKLPSISPSIDPFAHYKKTRGKMKGMDIEGFGKKDTWFKKLGTLWKINLFWKWIKGTWNAILKTNPILRSLMGLFDAAMSLISMALLFPFFEDIVGVLKSLLIASANFFSWSVRNKEGIRSAAGVGIKGILASLGLEGIIKAFSLLASWLTKVSPLFKYLGDLISPLLTWLGEKGLGGILKAMIGGFAKIINPLLWASFFSDIGYYIAGWIKGWSDNPIWVTFWTGIENGFDVLRKLFDIVGLLIAGFSDMLAVFGIGKGGNIKAWSQDLLDSFGKAFGFTPKKLATGGIVTSPTTALIGEAGPEAVIPLDKLGGMGSTSINVSGLVDEQKFRRIIQDEFNRMQGRLSRNRGAVSI